MIPSILLLSISNPKVLNPLKAKVTAVQRPTYPSPTTEIVNSFSVRKSLFRFAFRIIRM